MTDNMTDQQQPITPPPELQEEWLGLWPQDALLQASRWGANMELDACCDWLDAGEYDPYFVAKQLRAARRPKPLNLAEEALVALKRQSKRSVPSSVATDDCHTILRALERLQELEGQGNG